MCLFDRTDKSFYAEEPLQVHKVFGLLSPKLATFDLVMGMVRRGKWVRFDDRKSVIALGSLCAEWMPGFHAYDDTFPKEAIRVWFAGEIRTGWSDIEFVCRSDKKKSHTKAVKIVVGEWMYIPTDEELKDEDFKPMQAPIGKEAYIASLLAQGEP